MTIFATDSAVKLTSRQRRLRNVASIAMLQDFLEDNYYPSDSFTEWVANQQEFQIDTREFGLLAETGMTTATLTIITLLPLERHGHSLVHYRDEHSSYKDAVRGYAELNECGDMLTPLTPTELLDVYGDDIAATLADMVGDLREASMIMS